MSSLVALFACGALLPDTGADDPPTGASVERRPDGTPLSEGAHEAGLRVGTWTWWAQDGSFRSRRTYVDGVQHGPRHEVGLDGRIVELAIERGVLVGFRTLPETTPMPEWDGGQKVEGTRYARAHERTAGDGITSGP